MIRVEVFAEQPLHLGSQLDAGWLTDTHRFVPGSVLRGALAALWLAEHRPPKPDTTSDMEFQRLFEGGVRFGPLYPSDNALRPLSVFGCKYADDDTCRRFSHDAAFDGAAPAACPVCGSPVEASKGGVDGVRIVEHTRVQLDEHERAAEKNDPHPYWKELKQRVTFKAVFVFGLGLVGIAVGLVIFWHGLDLY